MFPFDTACIALKTFGRPYPYCMSHPGLAGQQFGAHGFCATSEAVARTTWIASSGDSGRLIFPSFAACFPYATTIAMSPPIVGTDSEVVPPCVAALNMLCVPHDVYPE